MKKLLCLIVALLLTHSDKCCSDIRYYVAIVFQDGSCYEEYMTSSNIQNVVCDFASDSSIESVFFTRDINYVPSSTFN